MDGVIGFSWARSDPFEGEVLSLKSAGSVENLEIQIHELAARNEIQVSGKVHDSMV